MQKGKDWDLCIRCIMSVTFTILQVLGTSQRCFSIGIMGRICDSNNEWYVLMDKPQKIFVNNLIQSVNK